MNLLKYIWRKRKFVAVVSILITLIYYGINCFYTYFSETGTISFIYPSSENGRYPDGTRFNIYDLMSEQVLQGTVDIYNERTGKKPIALADIENAIEIDEILPYGIHTKVQDARNSGQDYSYFANEYRVTVAPISGVYNRGISNLFGVIPDVDNKFLIESLYKSYTDYFMNSHAEMNIIPRITQNMSYEGYDYVEIADVFETRINMYITYLESKLRENGSYSSEKTGKSFNDLIAEFKNLNEIKVQNLKSFVSSSKLAKNPTEFVNKLRIQNESYRLYYNKLADEADAARIAMNEYDHTYEENIVITGQNEQLGLYQARPKTAYDTITKRALDVGVSAQAVLKDIEENDRLINEYMSTSMSAETQQRLATTADRLVSEIEAESDRLVALADETISDYLDTRCSDYVRFSASDKSYFSIPVLIKMILIFLLSVLCAILYIYLFDSEKKPGVQEITEALGIKISKRRAVVEMLIKLENNLIIAREKKQQKADKKNSKSVENDSNAVALTENSKGYIETFVEKREQKRKMKLQKTLEKEEAKRAKKNRKKKNKNEEIVYDIDIPTDDTFDSLTDVMHHEIAEKEVADGTTDAIANNIADNVSFTELLSGDTSDFDDLLLSEFANFDAKTEETVEVEPVEEIETVEEIAEVEPVEEIETVEETAEVEPAEETETVEEIAEVEPAEETETVEETVEVEPIEEIETVEETADNSDVFSALGLFGGGATENLDVDDISDATDEVQSESFDEDAEEVEDEEEFDYSVLYDQMYADYYPMDEYEEDENVEGEIESEDIIEQAESDTESIVEETLEEEVAVEVTETAEFDNTAEESEKVEEFAVAEPTLGDEDYDIYAHIYDNYFPVEESEESSEDNLEEETEFIADMDETEVENEQTELIEQYIQPVVAEEIIINDTAEVEEAEEESLETDGGAEPTLGDEDYDIYSHIYDDYFPIDEEESDETELIADLSTNEENYVQAESVEVDETPAFAERPVFGGFGAAPVVEYEQTTVDNSSIAEEEVNPYNNLDYMGVVPNDYSQATVVSTANDYQTVNVDYSQPIAESAEDAPIDWGFGMGANQPSAVMDNVEEAVQNSVDIADNSAVEYENNTDANFNVYDHLYDDYFPMGEEEPRISEETQSSVFENLGVVEKTVALDNTDMYNNVYQNEQAEESMESTNELFNEFGFFGGNTTESENAVNEYQAEVIEDTKTEDYADDNSIDWGFGMTESMSDYDTSAEDEDADEEYNVYDHLYDDYFPNGEEKSFDEPIAEEKSIAEEFGFGGSNSAYEIPEIKQTPIYESAEIATKEIRDIEVNEIAYDTANQNPVATSEFKIPKDIADNKSSTSDIFGEFGILGGAMRGQIDEILNSQSSVIDDLLNGNMGDNLFGEDDKSDNQH